MKGYNFKRLACKCGVRLLTLMAFAIIIFALLLSIARAITPMLDHQRVFFEQWASKILHQPVHIGHIRARWHGFEPELQFDRVVIQKPQQQDAFIRIKHLAVGINVVQSLWQRKLLPGRLAISGAKLALSEDKTGQLILKGVVNDKTQKSSSQTLPFKDTLLWLLTQADLSIEHVDITWRNASGTVLPIENLRLKVTNNVHMHQIAGIMKLAQKIPTQIRFIINLQDLDLARKQFSAQLYLQAKDLVFSQWFQTSVVQRLMPHIRVNRGRGDLQLWANWQQGQLDTIQGFLRARQIKLSKFSASTKHPAKKILINQLAGHIAWQRMKQGWRIKADNLHLKVNGITWPQNRLGYRVTYPVNGQPAQHVLSIDYLRLQDFQQLAKSIGYWPKSWGALYQHLKPRGDVSNILIQYSTQNNMSLSAHINEFGLTSWNKYPGVKGLSGYLFLSSEGGMVQINSKWLKLNLPKWYRKPLTFSAMKAFIRWHQHNSGLDIKALNVQFNNQDIQARAKLNIFLPKLAPPKLNLIGHFNIKHIGRLKWYLPERILSKQLVSWINQAFLGGQIKQGIVVFNGSVDDFPFAKHQGHFAMNALVNNVTLNYAPQWPAISEVYGRINMVDKTMQIHANKGNIIGARLKQVAVVIPDLRTPVLFVNGEVNSNLAKGLEFLRHSPLAIAAHLSNFKTTGSMQLNLKLTVPLSADEVNVDSVGSIAFQNAEMDLKPWHVKLDHLKGRLKFNNAKLSADHITASLYGEPAQISVATIKKPKQSRIIQVMIGGQFRVADLQRQFHFPLTDYFSGTSDYRAVLKLHDAKSSLANHFDLSTDLYGISTHNIPPPFAKTQGERRLLKLHMIINKNAPLQLKLKYGKTASAAFSFKDTPQGLNFESGELRLGDTRARFQHVPGLIIDGALKKVEWVKWKALIKQVLQSNHKAKQPSLSVPLHYVALKIAAFQAFNQSLHNVYVKLTQHKHHWIVQLKSTNIAGRLVIPREPGKTWRGQFQRLYLQKFKLSTKANHKPTHFDSRLIPSLNIQSKDFRYSKVDYGKLKLVTQQTRLGLNVTQLKTHSPLLVLSLSGYWHQIHKEQWTKMQGYFQTTNLSKLLSQMGVPKLLKGGRGSVAVSLEWLGAPYEIAAKKLEGRVKMAFYDGRVIHIKNSAESKLGLGRLINILSLQSIAKRLTLDFSDFSKKGFEFNTLKGDFMLDHGNAITRDTTMDGPVAKVQIKGRIGFAKKDYDLTLDVAPYITSSIPLIVGIAGGPVAGVLTWIVNKLLSPEIGKAFGFSFKVMGSWDHPKIKMLNQHHLVLPQPKATRTYIRNQS